MPNFILPRLFNLPNLRRSKNPRWLQFASYQTRKSVGAKPALYAIIEALRFSHLPDHARAAQNRLAHPRRHHWISVDERQKESQVLLRAAKVIAQRRAPLLAIRLNRI